MIIASRSGMRSLIPARAFHFCYGQTPRISSVAPIKIRINWTKFCKHRCPNFRKRRHRHVFIKSQSNNSIASRYRIIEKNGGKPPLTYHQFQSVVASMDPPESPVPTVTAACIGLAYTPLKEDHDDYYGVPTLEELGK